ncbi:MAG: hypothetical protein NC223_01180 [Butyrivibrio sp.]|nr:hypothetical protein [Butyrivibrio sp.]
MKTTVRLTHSSVLFKDGKPFVSVLFEDGEKSAEGRIPECVISINMGFSEAEAAEFEEYMRENKTEIIEAAKKITGIMHWLS